MGLRRVARASTGSASSTLPMCQSQTGSPAKPLAEYSVADIHQQFQCGKSCAARCPIAYAHLGSRLDGLRRQQNA